ncbi:MAG: septation protein SepH [Actinomycetota bacterium]|nr:septation protein SepH [Actinomycetota bacterium]
MRQLRFVGPGKDRDHVVLATVEADEQFVLYIDVSMRDAVRSDLPRLHHAAPEGPAAISPREIQMRVRGGASPQELADANEMSIERVLRFAGAVLEERSRVAQEARRSRARLSTSEGQTVVFGDAVDMRFAAHGIEPSAVTWDSRRREDGQWIVTARWIGGDAERVAEWAFNLGGRNVTPMDDTAADLLSDRPIRPLVELVPEPERPSLAAAPPLMAGVVAFPVLDSHEHASASGAREDVFDQEALDEDPRRVSTMSSDGDYHTPPLPLRLAEAPPAAGNPAPPATTPPTSQPGHANEPGPPRQPGQQSTPAEHPTEELPQRMAPPAPKLKNLGIAHREDETEEERAARARIPSWDDILMGVRRKND